MDSTKNVLNSLLSNLKTKSTTSKNILEVVSRFFDIGQKEIMGKSRKKELVYPRQITMYLMRKELNTSYPTIGSELGGRDHTTAMHAFKKIVREADNNERVKQDIESIKQALYASI